MVYKMLHDALLLYGMLEGVDVLYLNVNVSCKD